MGRRLKAKKGRPLKKKYIFIIILVLLTLISVQGFMFVERNLEPALVEIANTYVKQMATLAINEAISKKISEDFDDGGVLNIKRSADGKTQLISFNSKNQARILNQVIERANFELLKLEKEPFEIPLGQALDSNILAQFGPKVPVSLFPIGFAKADITVELEEAGINMVMVTAYIEIVADVRIVIPFSSDEAVVSTRYPIEWHLLQGEVPNVYFQGSDGRMSQPPVSIPVEEMTEER
ncbi:sporulation protein YunB [Caldalkalibacillus thermarum TA2.A1]|uniref:Sporulation protein YunB n=1 Tax=Caldalkalibacillus thermarum (strain TA2.A1) TaxID=986075 RepID=F5L6K0_CALTT|nr:sporulation protein YunB [Caldalkalibacillus thermarum]EGL83007.1 sporulation protein YunB [Caldalkalibacillus thermarum TA2.A1]